MGLGDGVLSKVECGIGVGDFDREVERESVEYRRLEVGVAESL